MNRPRSSSSERCQAVTAGAFPKDGHINLGVGGWLREGPNLRGHLNDLCAAHDIDPARLEGVVGYRLPLRKPDAALARRRALLVGDAAGLVDPISGDGMFECFVSARMASEAVLDVLSGKAETVEPYAERLEHRAAPACVGLLVGEDRVRPLSLALIPAHPTELRLADHRRADPR